MSEAPGPDELARQLGCAVPDALVTIVRIAHELASDGTIARLRAYRHPAPLALAGDAARYATTPPELFPIAATGADGEHWGYLVHAPELPYDDYPVATYCPMDGDGVLPLGLDTRDAWSRFLADVEADVPAALARRITCALRLDVPTSVLPERIVPSCPAGWRYVATADGSGVLAPSSAFDDEVLAREGDALDDVAAAAERALLRGRPATALLRIKEACWRSPESEALRIRLCKTWIAAYEALGRPQLADVIRRAR